MDQIRAKTDSRPYGIAPPTHQLPDAMRLGPVHLQVADLERSTAFYHDVIGLQVLDSANGVAHLGALGLGPALLVLHEHPGARPVPPRGRLGLFHVAMLLPDRPSLGRFLTHLIDLGIRPGMSDHLVSEALYLSDPDGLGLEIYADRPRGTWHALDRQVAMATEPLDVQSVLDAGSVLPWTGTPDGTTIGHIHLHVGDLQRAETFYHAALGLDKIVWQYPGALFLSAGGYHHHLGVNTWARGAEPARAEETRLLEWTIELPHADDVSAVAASTQREGAPGQLINGELLLHDPWGTAVRVRVASETP